ncbi:serine/threonine-protein kinase [Actinocorallia herbida]|nr:serine/threonine-protein kinase [Actinocorallia herbida]
MSGSSVIKGGGVEDGSGPSVGRELGGRYRLESLIGRGGMGQVWRAIDQRLRRAVAVKVLPTEIAVAEGGLARFEREAEATAALQHPGITVVFDIGQDEDGLTYLVMELLEGEDLRTVLGRYPDGMPVPRAVELALQLADALATAHAQGIVHRDIKPANLFVLKDGRLKLLDFGIAGLTVEATRLTRDGGSLGTPLYMAPEQFRGDPADFRSDLYALGGVLHELLTGRPPFASETGLPGLLYAHLNEPPPRVRSRRPEVPEGLEDLVLALLAKSVDQRPPSAAAVASYLRELPREGAPTGGAFPSPAPPPSAGASTPPPPQFPAPTMPPQPPARGWEPSTALTVGAVLLTLTVTGLAVLFAVNGLPGGDPSAGRSVSPVTASSPVRPVTPEPPKTPDKREIVYTLTGHASNARVMYMSPTGGSSSGTVKLPWTKKFTADRFTFLTVSVSAGPVTSKLRCRITVDGEVVQDGTSENGDYVSVSCTYSPYMTGLPTP